MLYIFHCFKTYFFKLIYMSEESSYSILVRVNLKDNLIIYLQCFRKCEIIAYVFSKIFQLIYFLHFDNEPLLIFRDLKFVSISKINNKDFV